jgi:hypothetical protein
MHIEQSVYKLVAPKDLGICPSNMNTSVYSCSLKAICMDFPFPFLSWYVWILPTQSIIKKLDGLVTVVFLGRVW